MKMPSRDFLSFLYHDSALARNFFSPLKSVLLSAKYNKIADRRFNEKRYEEQFGTRLRLSQPRTFNEKLQWLKLHDRTPLLTQCADKIAVRKIVADVIGEDYLIPLKFTTKDYRNISESTVSDNSVIKCNHDSMNVVIVHSASDVDFESVRQKMRKSLRRNFYYRFREWQYKNIPPTILVEQLIKDDEGQLPKDYKFFCFDGECKYATVDSDRFGKHKRDVFDTQWNRLPIKYRHENCDEPPAPPKHLNEMIELATKLSAPFPFVRIDFYDTGSKVYFGELTFHPSAGFNPIEPFEWQYTWGEQIPLRKSRNHF